MSEPIAPLPPEARQILRSAQETAPKPSSDATQRMLGRLQQSMAGPVSSGGAPAAAGSTLATTKLVAVAVAAALAGLAGGVVLGRTWWQPPPVVIEKRVEVQVPVPMEPVVAPTPTPQPAAVEAVPPKAAPQVRPPAAAPTVDEALARERELIDTARSALLRANPAGAVTVLQAHAAQFPSGRFAEERESLWVQALVAQGDVDGARARAKQFHAQFPKSLLGPTVDAALEP